MTANQGRPVGIDDDDDAELSDEWVMEFAVPLPKQTLQYELNPLGTLTRLRAELAAMTAELEATRKAALRGMDAAKAVSGGYMEAAHKMMHQSSPAALESERAMNAALTEELEAMTAKRDRLLAVCEAVDAWDLRWAAGLDENVERIKQLVREALRKEDTK